MIISISNSSRLWLDVGFVHSLRKVANTTSVRPHVVPKHEVPEDLEPRGVVGQVVVELGSDAPHLRQTVVRNVWEIVVLDVIAKIINEEIQRAVVAAGRLALREEIVLWDKVASQRVQPQSKRGPTQKVHEGPDAEEVVDQHVETDLDEEVDDLEG